MYRLKVNEWGEIEGQLIHAIIEDCLDYLGNKNYFSTLDMRNCFHQIPMHADSIKYMP